MASPAQDFTFKAEEKVVGDLTICVDSGDVKNISCLEFETSLKRKFSVGNLNTTQYKFGSKNSYLMGFYGKASSQINQLGAYFM